MLLSPILVSLGLACFGWTLIQVIRAHRSARWPEVQGELRATHSEDHIALEGALEQKDALRMRYTYEVAGKLYTGSRMYFGDHLVPPPASHYLDMRLSPGQAVTVRVNPRDPSDAVLETRAHPQLKKVFVVGATCIVAAPLAFLLQRSSSDFGGMSTRSMIIIVVGTLLFWLLRR